MSGHSLWLHGCCSNHSSVPLRRWLDLASMLAQEFSEFSTESGGESEKVRGGQRATGSGTPQPTVETLLVLSVTKWSLDVCDSVHTTATQCSTVWHLPTLPSDSAFPSAVGFVRAHAQVVTKRDTTYQLLPLLRPPHVTRACTSMRAEDSQHGKQTEIARDTVHHRTFAQAIA